MVINNKDLITVIIATYNRHESIKDILESLLNQECDGSFDYEVIIVDNNSNDKTKVTIGNYISKFNGKLRYLFEPRQGKSFALNKGIREAKGEIIAFTDDDCIVEKNWIQCITDTFATRNIDLLTSKVFPIFKTKKPKWLHIEAMKGPIVYYNLGNRYLENDEKQIPPCGPNMSIRKKSYQEFGGFAHCSRGQDSELFIRWRKLGAKMAYAPNPIVYHYTHPSRLTKNYFRKWYFLCGKHSSMFNKEKYARGRRFLRVPLWIYREILLSTLRFLKALILSDKDNFSKEIWIWYNLGMVFGIYGFEKLFEKIR